MLNVFNPLDHVIQIKTSNGTADYLPVQWRLVWLRQECPEATISTEILQLDLDREVESSITVWNSEKRRNEKVVRHGKGMAVVKATVTLPSGASATGIKMENDATFPEDYISKAETSAIGRALSALGYGTQFADDLNEENRLADAPVPKTSRPDIDPDKPATESQFKTIAKLQKELGLPESNLEGLNFADCAALLKELAKRVQLAKAS